MRIFVQVITKTSFMAHDLLKEIEQGSKNAILKKKIITYYILKFRI